MLNIKKGNSIDANSKFDLIVSCIKLLLASSSLLLTSSRIDLAYDIMEAIKLLPSSYISADIAQYLNQSLRKGNPHYNYYFINIITITIVPSFVINLDRRFDRWKKLLRASDCHGLNLMRISAIDGSDIAGFTIPESDVVKIWDSTLNATFDNRCLSNKVMHMTASEQACAASHLMIWRLIAKLRKTLISTNNIFKLPTTNIDDKTAVDDTFRDIDYGVSTTGVKNSVIVQETLFRSRLGKTFTKKINNIVIILIITSKVIIMK